MIKIQIKSNKYTHVSIKPIYNIDTIYTCNNDTIIQLRNQYHSTITNAVYCNKIIQNTIMAIIIRMQLYPKHIMHATNQQWHNNEHALQSNIQFCIVYEFYRQLHEKIQIFWDRPNLRSHSHIIGS